MEIKMIVSDRKFAPLFWTQFLGAFNDNFLKNALGILLAYKAVKLMGMDSNALVAFASGLLILPYFLFSPLAGNLADKFEKATLVYYTKIGELIIMVLAVAGFFTNSYALLLVVLFLMGTQSTFFGPMKYSIIPELVEEDNLTQANAYVELGTFIAILLGTIAGSLLSCANWLIAVFLLGVAVIGILASRQIPKVPIAAPNLKINYNPIPEMIDLWKILHQKPAIWNSVLAISWFWFFGMGVLAVLPIYGKDYLAVDEKVVTLFLAMFTIGIGVGSILCERLSFKRVEIGLVPIGSLGLTIFLSDIYISGYGWMTSQEVLMSVEEFWSRPNSLRLLIDFFLMSIFGGMFIVPLYTLLQERSEKKYLSRVIAGNNIVNAFFMVLASVVVMVFYTLNFNAAEIFLAFALLNVFVAIYVYSVVPEFTLRLYSWFLSKILYRVKVKGLDHIPLQGPCILASNHISWVDWLILYGACPRPARFVMYYRFFEIPIIKHIFKQAKIIPVATAQENEDIKLAAYEQIHKELRRGNVVIIFPEGTITQDGELCEFRPGILKILKEQPVPVVPVALKGLWGSMFSRYWGGRALKRPPQKFRRKIEVEISEPIRPEDFQLDQLKKTIQDMLSS